MPARERPRSLSFIVLGTTAVVLLSFGDSAIPGAAGNPLLRAANPVAAAAHNADFGLPAGYTLPAAAATTPTLGTDVTTSAASPALLPAGSSVAMSPTLLTPPSMASSAAFLAGGAPAVAPATGKEVALPLPAVENGPVPAIAADAYRRAAASVTCGLQWSLLAGIGKIESDHGRHAGSSINTYGQTVPPIYGPPTYLAGARAEGPMQFMPTTWAQWASDGNADGKTDPQNIYDETVAAARYLCAAGGDLSTPVGVRRAVFAYNHLDSYVADVLAYAAAYAGGAPESSVSLIPITYPAHSSSASAPSRVDAGAFAAGRTTPAVSTPAMSSTPAILSTPATSSTLAASSAPAAAAKSDQAGTTSAATVASPSSSRSTPSIRVTGPRSTAPTTKTVPVRTTTTPRAPASTTPVLTTPASTTAGTASPSTCPTPTVPSSTPPGSGVIVPTTPSSTPTTVSTSQTTTVASTPASTLCAPSTTTSPTTTPPSSSRGPRSGETPSN